MSLPLEVSRAYHFFYNSGGAVLWTRRTGSTLHWLIAYDAAWARVVYVFRRDLIVDAIVMVASSDVCRPCLGLGRVLAEAETHSVF